MDSTQLLTFLDFSEGFAVDAKGCGRAGFQALYTYLDSTGVTVPVVVDLDPLQGAVNFFDQFTFTITGAKLKTELFFLGRTIRWIREVCGSSFMCETVRVISSTSSARQT